MGYVTYNLKGNSTNSNMYYEKISAVSSKIKKLILNKDHEYLNDFMSYIEENKIESLRTKEEYGIEFLMIGVMLSEYSAYGNILTKNLSFLFRFLNNQREKSKYKDRIDIIRGYLISNILCKKNKNEKYDIRNLICWMDECGDFEEEVHTLKRWISFLEDKEEKYYTNLIKDAINLAEDMENICKEYLEVYLKPLEEFLKTAPQRYKNREDLIYCIKGKRQYYFNMVGAQIMNEIYHKEFMESKKKMIFAPACMRQLEKECRADAGEFGYECRKCNSSCNINFMNKILGNNNIEVCIIPHETIINKLCIEEENRVGIIGIACISNLMSGGWKALRLGFIPQCVLLDYCGCRKHWSDKGIMTSINWDNLYKIILK